jgi:3-deoxy-D-manno-octulosonate 8-phosphate phosphatase KdsC-like HAD superfamily phosphatase
MTKRTPYGYTHNRAFRTWLPEQEELLRIIAYKGRDATALSQTMSLEALAVVLERSPSSIATRAAKLQVNILSQEQLDQERALIELDAKDFVDRYI